MGEWAATGIALKVAGCLPTPVVLTSTLGDYYYE
jgi:hypothetical protein